MKLPPKKISTLSSGHTSTEQNAKEIEESIALHETKDDAIEFFSLGILKPDCVKRELAHEAFRRISNVGLEIVLSKTITLTDIDVLLVYSRCVEKPFFDSMKKFLTSSDCIVFIVKSTSNDAVKKLNSVVGSTDPIEAKAGTLRELGKNLTNNIAHSSNNSENFIKESWHLFSEHDLIKAGLNIDHNTLLLKLCNKRYT